MKRIANSILLRLLLLAILLPINQISNTIVFYNKMNTIPLLLRCNVIVRQA